MTFTAPGGNPAPLTGSQMRRADSEIISEGLRAVYPGAAKAGPIFHFVNVTEKRQRGISIGTPTEDVRWDFQGGGGEPSDTDRLDPSVPRFSWRILGWCV